ncbi:MAG: ketoacyl-ACP synthase III [Myxococcales bacterium]|nr:ketoacyl-ACP synthase III [Myxococcales bacterium]MBL0192621.1 ketoacyl-ACP synthase III [Myxococcales bacterium]HQY62912.1 beta-ketoacyl-ACP synthase III [Polyangiaceae bacterium]
MLQPASRILGTGHFLPPNVRTNHDIERMVDTSDQWIMERTGIRERRIASPEMVTSDMAAEAARAALTMAGLKASDLDMIIVGTVTPDMPMPATAVFVQQKIGAGHCPAFDISAACAGFLFGLTLADGVIRTGVAKHVLVIGVELLSRVVDWEDRTTCVLFGDGAGAAVFGPSEGKVDSLGRPRGVLASSIHSDGELAASLWIPGGGSRTPASADMLATKAHKVHMRGQDIFKVAIKSLYSASKAAVEKAGMTPDEVDWVCPHQANLRIIDQATTRLGVPKEKILVNLERVGNTSSASIPILLDESLRSGKVKEGDSVVMCALGAGVSWGGAVVRV